MPGMDGIELVKILRGTPSTSTIPILMISGQAAEEQRLRGFELGADSYLPKPYTLKELRVRIRALLQTVQLRVETTRVEERARAERDALAERAALLESITDGFYALDHEWRVTYANRRALDYFQRTPETLIGRVIFDEFPQARHSVIDGAYRSVMETRRPESFEFLSPVT